jgi:hypothetical protein
VGGVARVVVNVVGAGVDVVCRRWSDVSLLVEDEVAYLTVKGKSWGSRFSGRSCRRSSSRCDRSRCYSVQALVGRELTGGG